jgi:regulator of chromosome condensation
MLALDSHGAIYAWGCGEQSQLGRPIMDSYRTIALAPSLVRIPGTRGKNKIISIAAGQFNSFALTATGGVYAWGLNNFAQTGIAPAPADEDGEQDPRSLIVPKPKRVESLSTYTISSSDSDEKEHITALAGGNHHSLALTSSGTVLSFGRCDSSQAGVPLSSVPKEHLVFDDRGNARILAVPTPITALKGKGVRFVATGIDNSIAVTGDGKAYSWGFSANYRTGLGTEDEIEEPTLLENGVVKGKKIVWAGCGGQFSVLAGTPAEDE